jgi:hypothetical protein
MFPSWVFVIQHTANMHCFIFYLCGGCKSIACSFDDLCLSWLIFEHVCSVYCHEKWLLVCWSFCVLDQCLAHAWLHCHGPDRPGSKTGHISVGMCVGWVTWDSDQILCWQFSCGGSVCVGLLSLVMWCIVVCLLQYMNAEWWECCFSAVYGILCAFHLGRERASVVL